MAKAAVVTVQESAAVPFNLIGIDLDFNIRDKERGYRDIEELAEMIRGQGLITPLTIREALPHENPDGKTPYILLSGHRRYHALKLLKVGDSPVNTVIRKVKSDAELYLANAVENTGREDTHPADLARRFWELESGTYRSILNPVETEEGAEPVLNEKVERKVIASQTGLSTAHIGNLIRVHQNLPDSVKKMWRKHEIPMSKIIKWAALEGEEAQLEAFGEWKEQQDQEKSEGRKRRQRASQTQSNGASNGHSSNPNEADEGEAPSAPSKNEVRLQLEALKEKMEGLKGTELEIIKAKHKALRWVLGEISRI